ncbi:hypothetical protein B0T26DRAFT_671852 [Lasiosphaeria miniovina]|uniref:Uncharacterized protein n=1 Tax=Lasiosphaeria miniovina TaxID=1954250 RepID=A0AA40E4V0_9PEZI|nr:uncharacterized protein B0T26DRAFT_671852 [Lasiosphaeria miniovina]KAK0727145.1 hypothetical protein B0T26DRAFT_671852 [Lasiosphaeria miniovina]
MSLKYIGVDEKTAQPHIVVHCDKRVAKTVKKFFNQENVLEDLKKRDFQLQIVDNGLFTNVEASLSSAATIGGLILVTHSERTLPALYAITAHHPLRKLYQECEDESGPDDDDECLELRRSVEDVSASALAHVPDKHDFTRTIGRVPDTFCRSVHRPRNSDWVLVEIDRREWKPNLLVELLSTGSSVIGTLAKARRGDCPNEQWLQTRRDGGQRVVGAKDGFVYGHVVSVDSFGEAYVIPMCDMLSEVRSLTGAKCVSLPSGGDVVFMRGLGL